MRDIQNGGYCNAENTYELEEIYGAILGEASGEYTITYHGNGNTSGSPPAVQNAAAGQSTTISNRGSLARTGYTFVGWNTKADYTGATYNPGSEVYLGLDLHAMWRYTVTYNANGGTGTLPAAQTALSGKSVTLSAAPNLTNPGSVLVGWNERQDGKGTSCKIGQSVVFNGDTPLFAQWDSPQPPDSSVNDKIGAMATMNTMTVFWDKVDGVDWYEISLKDPGGIYSFNLIVNATSCTFDGLTPGQTYNYQIRSLLYKCKVLSLLSSQEVHIVRQSICLLGCICLIILTLWKFIQILMWDGGCQVQVTLIEYWIYIKALI